MKEYFLSWGMLVLSVVCNAFGAFIIKARLNELGPIRFDSFGIVWQYSLDLLKAPVVIVGVILFFAAPFLFAVSLSRMEITTAYPVQIGLNFLLVVLLAFIFLGEHMTAVKLYGIILISLGVVLLHR